MLRRIQQDLARRYGKRHVSVVKLSGILVDSTPPRANELSLARFDKPLRSAFASNPKAVALAINSPGGSAVQSQLLVSRIKGLQTQYETIYGGKIPVIAFVEDLAASGGYYISCAAEKIVCDRSSILGSIGVIHASFGFTGLMEKWGIERRVETAGKSKSQLDPFAPRNEEDIAHVREQLASIHAAFIDTVKLARGDKLAADDDTLFNGKYWTGEQAIKLGLADEIGNLHSYCSKHFGDDQGHIPLRQYKPASVFPFGG